MAKQTVNIGAHPSDGSGDPLRVSFSKINANFTELYTAIETIVPIGGNSTPVTGIVTSVAGKSGNVILTVSDVAGAVSKNYVDTRVGEVVGSSIDTQLNALIDAAPEALNTMREFAAAIQNDPNYYLTVSAQLGDKLSKSAGGSMAGPLYLRDALPTQLLEATTKKYVDNKIQVLQSNLAVKQLIIDDLSQQLTAKADRSSVYTKGEIDATVLNITSKVVTAPATANGKAGDSTGMVAFDSNFMYYCNADYTDGVSPIWQRSALVGASW